MINILVVDDYDVKRARIVRMILDHHDIQKDLIYEASSVKDARRSLYRHYFDLMILDLVLPVEEFGECLPEHGLSFLNEVGINPNIKPPIHIVGMSGFKDRVSEHSGDFQDKLWNLIEYEETSSEWEDRLKSIIFHLVRARQQFIAATSSNPSDIMDRFLQEKKLPNTLLGVNWQEVSKNIADIVERSLAVPNKFSNGQKARNINASSIKIISEYDYQNLIHLVLRPWIPSLEPENLTIIFDGNQKNADFSVKGNLLIVEAKYIDSAGKKNDVLKTLEGLKSFYSNNANVKALLFLLLVERTVTIDRHKIEEEFSRLGSEPSICVRVMFNT